MKTPYSFEPYCGSRPSQAELESSSRDFLALMCKRRSVRDFSDRAVPESVIQNAIKVAANAPSGANMQPWYFVAIQDKQIKREIRLQAEAEERELYAHRASDEWLRALAPLGTNAEKPFLETAPWLIAIFSQKYSVNEKAEKSKHYYTPESVGIATGMLITALHYAGLATLTHTPSPMGFLRHILNRPDAEKPFLLLVVGYPADDAKVPVISKKLNDQFMHIV